jgi:hypothetical protein
MRGLAHDEDERPDILSAPLRNRSDEESLLRMAEWDAAADDVCAAAAVQADPHCGLFVVVALSCEHDIKRDTGLRLRVHAVQFVSRARARGHKISSSFGCENENETSRSFHCSVSFHNDHQTRRRLPTTDLVLPLHGSHGN